MTRQLKVFAASFDPFTEPIPFELQFTNVRTNETLTHPFAAQGDPGAGADFTRASIVVYDEETKRRFTDLNGLRQFFKRVLLDDGYERLETLLADPTVTVPMDMLTGVFYWLTEEWSGRPTRPSSPSSAGQPTNGNASTEPLSSVAST